MDWKLGQAKQSLSQLVENAALEPQCIFKRNQPAVFVIDYALYQDFLEFRRARKTRSLAAAFHELRGIMAEENTTLTLPVRTNRKTAFPAK